MRTPKITLIFLFLLAISFNGIAAEIEYKVDSKVLTIPAMKIGNGYLYDVKLRLNQFDIISFSKSPSLVSHKNRKCTEEKILLSKYNQIETGMTLNQVNNIIGCKGKLDIVVGNRSLYKWVGTKSVVVPKIGAQVVDNLVVHKTYAPPK